MGGQLDVLRISYYLFFDGVSIWHWRRLRGLVFKRCSCTVSTDLHPGDCRCTLYELEVAMLDSDRELTGQLPILHFHFQGIHLREVRRQAGHLPTP